MLDTEPLGPWQIESLLRDNIREAQQRMERDVLLFGLLTVVYVVLQFANVDEISAAGVTISQPQYAQFAIVPYALLVCLRFMKAQALRDTVFKELVQRGSLVPRQAAVLDWSLAGDRSRRYRPARGLQAWVTPTMMWVGFTAGYVVNFVVAESSELLVWAWVTLAVGFGLVALMGVGRSAWSGAFYWAEPQSEPSKGTDKS